MNNVFFILLHKNEDDYNKFVNNSNNKNLIKKNKNISIKIVKREENKDQDIKITYFFDKNFVCMYNNKKLPVTLLGVEPSDFSFELISIYIAKIKEEIINNNIDKIVFIIHFGGIEPQDSKRIINKFNSNKSNEHKNIYFAYYHAASHLNLSVDQLKDHLIGNQIDKDFLN